MIDLKETKKQLEQVMDPLSSNFVAQDMAQIGLDLIAEIERLSEVHREEQRRSADRLRAALENVP